MKQNERVGEVSQFPNEKKFFGKIGTIRPLSPRGEEPLRNADQAGEHISALVFGGSLWPAVLSELGLVAHNDVFPI